MLAGDTFIPVKFDCHLWIIVSDPSVDPENVVIVNFTTHTVDEEQHCILNKGDHPFVQHKTSVRYWDAKAVSVAQLQVLTRQGQLIPNAPLSPALLDRVRIGAAKSEHLPEGCRRILDEQGLI